MSITEKDVKIAWLNSEWYCSNPTIRERIQNSFVSRDDIALSPSHLIDKVFKQTRGYYSIWLSLMACSERRWSTFTMSVNKKLISTWSGWPTRDVQPLTEPVTIILVIDSNNVYHVIEGNHRLSSIYLNDEYVDVKALVCNIDTAFETPHVFGEFFGMEVSERRAKKIWFLEGLDMDTSSQAPSINTSSQAPSIYTSSDEAFEKVYHNSSIVKELRNISEKTWHVQVATFSKEEIGQWKGYPTKEGEQRGSLPVLLQSSSCTVVMRGNSLVSKWILNGSDITNKVVICKVEVIPDVFDGLLNFETLL
jgi:hypothetical protein